MIRKHKKYAWPRKLYDSARIKDENLLVEKYGLKNKKEIWKTDAKVKYFRSRAKKLITADQELQENFFAKLNKIGLNVNSIADVLALNKEDLLKRRLSSVMFKLGISKTPREARQMITHKRVMISDQIVNSPSYLVELEEESKIKLKPAKIKVQKEDSNE